MRLVTGMLISSSFFSSKWKPLTTDDFILWRLFVKPLPFYVDLSPVHNASSQFSSLPNTFLFAFVYYKFLSYVAAIGANKFLSQGGSEPHPIPFQECAYRVIGPV